MTKTYAGRPDPHPWLDPEPDKARGLELVAWWVGAVALSCLFWAVLVVAYLVGQR